MTPIVKALHIIPCHDTCIHIYISEQQYNASTVLAVHYNTNQNVQLGLLPERQKQH